MTQRDLRRRHASQGRAGFTAADRCPVAMVVAVAVVVAVAAAAEVVLSVVLPILEAPVEFLASIGCKGLCILLIGIICQAQSRLLASARGRVMSAT